MIKANELRIGNWISFFNGIEPERYVQINARFFCSLANGRPLSEMKVDEEFNNYYHPIQLTPEILEKCGFKYGVVEGIATIGDSYNDTDEEGDTEYWDKGKLTIVNWGKKEFILSHKSSFDHRIELKSIHQLQNLYYALTGEELEIKNKIEAQ